jgi:hypothetical protein
LQINSAALPQENKNLDIGMHDAVYQARTNEREDRTMKTTMARKAAYMGAGAGMAAFALFGLMPGSLLGGAAGIHVAGMLFGLPLESGLITRVIVLASMLVGVLASGIVVVTAATTAGWVIGQTADALMPAGNAEVTVSGIK